MGDSFTYNYNFIPIAATVIYSIALGLPFALKLLMRVLGSNFFNGTFIEVRLKFLKLITNFRLLVSTATPLQASL
jgi:hypothetical protein